MICAIGVVGPDGNTYLVLDGTRADISTCPYVVQTATEVANGLPLTLSMADGATYGFELSTVLLAAWAGKMAIRALGGTRNEAESPE